MRILPAVTLALALSAKHSAAQSGNIPPPPPPPPPPSSSSEAGPELSAPPDPPPVNPVDHSDEGRVRWGVNGQLGWFIPQPVFTFGVEGRAGWSFNKLVAAYMSGGVGGGLYIGITNRSFEVSAMSHWFVGVMGEINVGDLFFVALGPAVGEINFGGINLSSSSSGTGAQVQALAGITPSVDFRLGFGFGKRKPESGRRGGFTLALDLRAFFPTNTAFVTVGSNGQRVTTYGIGYGLAPMLMLGYDSR